MSQHELPAMIVRLYGTQRMMAKELGVTAQTVTNWVKRNPQPMMAHAYEICERGITFDDLSEIIRGHARQLHKHSYEA